MKKNLSWRIKKKDWKGKLWVKTESQGWCWRLWSIIWFESDSRKGKTTCKGRGWVVLQFENSSGLFRRRQWHPTPVLLPGKSHGQRSLVGCSPWGREESDTTERLHFHALEKEMAPHSSILAWRIPGTGEPRGLPSTGSHRVGHNWSDLAAAAGLFSSVQFSRSVMSDSLWPHGLQHARPPCPSPTPGVYSNSCPLSRWCNHLILCCPLLLLPSIFPSIKVFPNESVLHNSWPKYWSFSFNIRPSNEYSEMISFRMDLLDLLAVQGTLKSLFQHHSSKASILQCSAFFPWTVWKGKKIEHWKMNSPGQ